MAFGLRMVGTQGHDGFTGNLAEFAINPSNANPIYSGDPVVLAGGFVVAATNAATAILGVFAGCSFVEPDGSQEFKDYWSGAANRTDIRCSIHIPTAGRFWIQGEPGVNFAAATSIGAAHPFDINAGNALTGMSGTTLAAPGAGPFVVHRLADIPNNSWGTGGPILEGVVTLQQGTFASAS